MPHPLPVTTRIERSVTLLPTGCWEWKLRRNNWGYGLIKVGGRMQGAHRVAYEALKEPIPAGLTLDHICKNAACVNPEHLEPVTMRENLMRGSSFSAVNARKTHCAHGHPFEGANLYVTPTGRRSCRRCNADAQRRSKAGAK